MFDANHDVCFLEFVNDVSVHSKSKSAKKSKNKNIWKPTGKVFTDIRYKWKPTGRTFTIAGKTCPLTRITSTSKSVTTQNPQNKVDNRRPNITKSIGSSSKSKVFQIVLWYLDSECSKHMTGNRSQIINFVYKFLGTVRFGNDQIAKIMGYGDYQMGNVTISQVYYVEVLGHNLFYVGQFCDSDLEVAFRKHTCYIRDLEGVDLLKGSRGTNLYTLSLEDMMLSSPICLLSKASKTKSWLWHRRLSNLNFDYITTLAILGLQMFDEYFNPLPSVASLVPTVAALVPADSIGSPSLTPADQDAPSPSTSQTPQASQSLVASPGIIEEFHDIEVAHLNNDPFFGVPILVPTSKESSSRDVIPTNVHLVNQPPEHLSKWTKDHLLYNNDKEALKESCWIEAMKEELNEFERLEVWELVPRRVMS
ncbi:integrase, catalytic region, zinc finger, CCHC-type containing protein [Tanacetum coccineum]